MSARGQSFRFGPFVLDLAAYQLTRDDVALALSPKALDLLQMFAGRPGELLTKDDILAVLWPDVAVTDNALTQVVSEVRQALGDSSSSPRFVETVPRRGYRFIATVEKAEAPGRDQPVRARTIAVNDFTNVTGDQEVSWLGAGIAETVTNDLRAIGDLRVIDRAMLAEAARGGDGSVVAGHLDLLVVGSYQRLGDRLRITARVIEVATQEARAHGKADGPLGDIFQLQDEIVTQLTLGLRVTLTPIAAARIRARETSNLEAYQALTEGRLKLETLDPARVTSAMEDFERAIALDGRYTHAHVGLAHARFWRFAASRERNRPSVDDLVAAIAHARRAVELDPYQAEAHAALALFLASAERPAEAVAAGRLAVSLEPGNWRHQFRLGVAAWGEQRLGCLDAVVAAYPPLAYAYFLMAIVHVARGDMRRADDVLKRGVAHTTPAGGERFPGAGLHWLRGLTRLAVGDAAGARVEFDRELAATVRGLLAEEFTMDAYAGHGFALLETGDAAGANSMFQKALERFPDHARLWLGLAVVEGQRGQNAARTRALGKAGKAIEELAKHGRTSEALMATACAHAVADRPTDAIASLTQLLAEAPLGSAGWTIPIEPLLAPLRDAPAFQPVLTTLAERAR